MTATNTVAGSSSEDGKPITDSQERMYLKGLPKVVREYLLFDSPVFWCPREVYKIYRKYGKDKTLRALMANNKMDMNEVYGPDHTPIKGVHYN